MDGESGLDVLSNDDMLEIIPPKEYDPFEAKFCASLFWLVFHATECEGLEDVPSQVTTPVQRFDKKNGFLVHPEIVDFLCKGEVYCTVCARIFPGKVALVGHWSVIQTLSRNGVYVVDSMDIAVTEAALEQNNPFNQAAHIALMDALMNAYSSQVVTIQGVVQAVRRYSSFSASRELPFDLDDALLLWVNKTNAAVNARLTKDQDKTMVDDKLLGGRERMKKVGLRPEENVKSMVFPEIHDLLEGLWDGRALLGVLLFYEPNVVNIENVRCSSELCTEDAVHNLDLFFSLCSQYFCTSVLALKVEDILYSSCYTKINIVALLAEMYSKCEGDHQQSKNDVAIRRSKTSCSDKANIIVNGEVRDGFNGTSDDICGNRSRSAPILRGVKECDKMPIDSLHGRNDANSQNFNENSLLQEIRVADQMSSSSNAPANLSQTSPTSSHVTSSRITSLNCSTSTEDSVEVHGVIVKLRKKLPRSVEPGGGHEALLSRRMKKSLCGRSLEDGGSLDQSMPSGERVEQTNEKSCLSEELHESPQLQPLVNSTQNITPGDHLNSLSLNLKNFPENDLPVDMLSPISENTEPEVSPGNSLNNSMSLTHEAQKDFTEKSVFDLSPPQAFTPRKPEHDHSRNDFIPRGSYILTDVHHTPESACAAGIPIVERELMSRSNILDQKPGSPGSKAGETSSKLSTKTIFSNDELESTNFAALQFLTNEELASHANEDVGPDIRRNTMSFDHSSLPDISREHFKNDARCSLDQRKDMVGDYLSQKMINPRYPTFTKRKNPNDDVGDVNRRGELLKNSSSNVPSLSWSSLAKKSLGSGAGGNQTQAASVSKKTNWGEMVSQVDDNTSSYEKERDAVQKTDAVSRELNLLRLRLAEKQRDIVAQKQRTKEQLEEERKKVGQNVFWLAVGKNRERTRDENEKSLSSKQSSSKFLSVNDELPPSMDKLQDRSYEFKIESSKQMKSQTDERNALSNTYNNNLLNDGETLWNQRDLSSSVDNEMGHQKLPEDIVQFRLSRQQPDLKESSPPSNATGDVKCERKTIHSPVLNYRSRISMPIASKKKQISEKEEKLHGTFDSSSDKQAISPPRKCWGAKTAGIDEPYITITQPDFHVEKENASILGDSQNSDVLKEIESINDSDDKAKASQEIIPSPQSDTGDLASSPDLENENVLLSSGECDSDQLKKGMTLFIGEENTISNSNGITPEQLRKKEKFLRNRQLKMEEDKLRREALLEKKRRKEEKMKEIQERRELEEQSRQAKLQEKREQAEHAKHERQKYEMRRKENLTNVHRTAGGNKGYTRKVQGIDQLVSGYNQNEMDTPGYNGGYSQYYKPMIRTTSVESGINKQELATSSTSSAFSGFTGVQSYVKPSGKTNRKLIINAISHVCLPGTVNKDTKEKCLQAMTESSAQHFLILFKDGLKFRSLYSLDIESGQVLKVYGIGPRSVSEKMIEYLYKYNSGCKEFSKIPAKTFSLSVDGFTIQKSFWQTSKPSVASKTASNFKQSSYKSTR